MAIWGFRKTIKYSVSLYAQNTWQIKIYKTWQNTV